MKLFISRNREDIPADAYGELAKRHELYCHTMIRFEYPDFDIPGAYDFLFFSSERAVKAFFRLHSPLPGSQCICVGEHTACELQKYGYGAGLVFEKSGEPAANEKQLSEFMRTGTVLFPVSNRSNLTYANMLTATQRLIVTAYRTIPDPQLVPPCDCYVFTSPSNLHAFFNVNRLPKNAQCIAWGRTTEHALRKAGIIPFKTLTTASFGELANSLH